MKINIRCSGCSLNVTEESLEDLSPETLQFVVDYMQDKHHTPEDAERYFKDTMTEMRKAVTGQEAQITPVPPICHGKVEVVCLE